MKEAAVLVQGEGLVTTNPITAAFHRTMASYDSDSSSEDGVDVQTNVTLGYATAKPTGDETSHVGGLPTWIDESDKPRASLVRCKVCNSYMSLLLQLQADLQQKFPDDERKLYVWCCRKKQCSKKPGSVRAFRETRKAKTTRKTKVPVAGTETKVPRSQMDLGSQLFGGSKSPSPSNDINPCSTSSTNGIQNPFSTGSGKLNAVGLFSDLAAKSPQPPTQSFADKLKLSDAHTSSASASTPQPQSPDPWPTMSEFPAAFPNYFLDAEGEYLDPLSEDRSLPSSSDSRVTELEDERGSNTTSSTTEKDLYESPHDKTFDHFTKILSQNPEQVLRYEWSGMPLLYNSTDSVATRFVLPGHHLHQKAGTAGPTRGVPRCDSCGGARVFECQLVPYLIFELEKDDEDAMSLEGGMEWGTILVGTCSRNCGEEGKIVFREEWAGVQWEESGGNVRQ